MEFLNIQVPSFGIRSTKSEAYYIPNDNIPFCVSKVMSGHLNYWSTVEDLAYTSNEKLEEEIGFLNPATVTQLVCSVFCFYLH